MAYSEVSAVFELRDEADSYQIQLSLAPCSYSMYLGNRAGREESATPGGINGQPL